MGVFYGRGTPVDYRASTLDLEFTEGGVLVAGLWVGVTEGTSWIVPSVQPEADGFGLAVWDFRTRSLALSATRSDPHHPVLLGGGLTKNRGMVISVRKSLLRSANCHASTKILGFVRV